ncbi:MAG: hypothetical protein PVF49_11610, partial [Anaerolineales bacterium]
MTQFRRMHPILIALVLVACTAAPLNPNNTFQATSAEVTLEATEVEVTRTPPPTAQATPIFSQLNQELAMRGSFSADVAALDGIPVYQLSIEVEFNQAMDQATISGDLYLTFDAPGEEALTRFPLMLWPNNEQYQADMTVSSAVVNGYAVDPQADGVAPAIWLELYQPVEPGQEVVAALSFEVVAYEIGQAAPKRFGITPGGVLIAPTFYPLLPLWLGDGWQVEQAPPGGDTTNSEVAFYEIEINAPADLGLAASGAEVDRQETNDGRQHLRLATGPVRDVAFALGPFEVLIDEVGE